MVIVSPAAAQANNGNAHTAARWLDFLAPVANADVTLAWRADLDDPTDGLIALHARRSGDSILRFREAHPDRPIALVLTGTDLYRDLDSDRLAQHALECASHLVVLQEQGLHRLPVAAHGKARVIVQSATRMRHRAPVGDTIELVAVGHLRDEKDPLTLIAAARALPAASPIRISHIGAALDAALGREALRAQQDCPHYRWLGEQPHAATRRRLARSHALVHPSRMEGGANVVIEALRSGVPVLSSRIDGNVGLLGVDHGGYFPVGDAPALAALMQRFASDAAFVERLTAQGALREPLFAPAAERAAVRGLLRDMLAASA